jgi:hypothetical protein
MSKEVHQLAQGKLGLIDGTNTIFFLSAKQVWYIPTNWTVMYGQIVINHCVHRKKALVVFASLLAVT